MRTRRPEAGSHSLWLSTQEEPRIRGFQLEWVRCRDTTVVAEAGTRVSRLRMKQCFVGQPRTSRQQGARVTGGGVGSTGGQSGRGQTRGWEHTQRGDARAQRPPRTSAGRGAPPGDGDRDIGQA